VSTENDELLSELAAETAEAQSEQKTPVDSLKALQTLGSEALQIADWIKRAEAKIEERKARLNKILSREMIDIMGEVNIDSITVDGVALEAANYYKASIPEEHRDAGHNWLEEQEFGDLIKYQVIITVPTRVNPDDEDDTNAELIKKIENAVRQLSNEAEVEVKRQVPWKRLTSWLKEYVEKVLPNNPELPAVPLDILGATVGRVVKIKSK